MRRPALLALAAGCSVACSGAVISAPPPRAQAPFVDPGPGFVTPARWDYHPAPPTTALAAEPLADGSCVFTAEGGQRWSAAATKRAGGRLVCAGKAEASPAVAQEDLTSIIRREGSWLFVGDTGALYEASEALGAFTRPVPAPEPLAKVVGAGTGVLAATQEGRIRRWEPATGWGPPSASPALLRARVFDLVAGGGRRVLALAFPEALFASEDDGATWSAAAAPVVGARRVGAASGGDLGAQGVLESAVWRGSSFVRTSEKIAGPQASLDVEAGRAPSAAALISARAVLDGDRYYEVVHPDNDGDLWLLARGRLDGRLETTPIADSERCANVRLGARGKVVYTACVFTDGGEIAAEIRKSADAGATWGEALKLATPDTDQIFFAVSGDGNAMATGVCRSTDATGSCKPGSPLLLREGAAADPDAGPADAGAHDAHDAGGDAGAPGPALHAVPSSAPQLSGGALAPVFGPDGRSAYYLGKRGKDERTTLFISHDGGETFAPRTLQMVSAVPVRRHVDGEDEPQEPEAPETVDIDENSSLRPGDDGVVGVTVTRSRSGSAYATVDDDGHVIQISTQPLDDEGNTVEVAFAGFGRRVIALPNDAGPGVYYESADGGASWDKETMPQALTREYARAGLPTVVCALAGCVIGETVSRVGWGAAPDASPPDRQPDAPPSGGQSVLTPIVCDLSATTKWSRIDDLYEQRNGAPVPISELARGRTVWTVLSLDRATGALATTSAVLPESGEGEARVVRRPLIGPAGPHSATAISGGQVEGYAVVRAAYPTDAAGKPKVGAPLRNVEVAWENFFEGASGHARIPDAGPLEKDEVVLTPGAASDGLSTEMISVTSHGFFVRPHRAHVRSGIEFFVDPAGRLERYTSTPWPESTALGQTKWRSDAAAIGGELLGVGLMIDNGAWGAAVLAKRAPGGGGWSYAAEGLVPNAVGSLETFTGWAWSAKAPVGVYTVVADPQRAKAWAHFVGFRGDGGFQPAQPVPTLYDLGERPRACSNADRTSTARVPLALSGHNGVLYPGARHPVLVQEPRPKNAVGIVEPIALATAGAVVHGTPEAPCLAAFEAESAVSGGPMGAVIPGDLARSWLFRVTYDGPPRPARRGQQSGPAPALEYRPMVCHYDPTARIPEPIWNMAGTSRP